MKIGNTLGRKGFLRLVLPASMLALSMAALQGCMDTGSLFDSSSKEQARIKSGPEAPADKPVGIQPIVDTGMACIQVIVCGKDGRIYSDPCAAAAAGVEYGYDLTACKEVSIDPPIDPIEPPGMCTADYSPVCGADGKTYSNACNASLRKVKVIRSGPCD